MIRERMGSRLDKELNVGVGDLLCVGRQAEEVLSQGCAYGCC